MRDCGSIALEIGYIRQGAKRWHKDSQVRAIAGLTAAASMESIVQMNLVGE